MNRYQVLALAVPITISLLVALISATLEIFLPKPAMEPARAMALTFFSWLVMSVALIMLYRLEGPMLFLETKTAWYWCGGDIAALVIGVVTARTLTQILAKILKRSYLKSTWGTDI